MSNGEKIILVIPHGLSQLPGVMEEIERWRGSGVEIIIDKVGIVGANQIVKINNAEFHAALKLAAGAPDGVYEYRY